MDVIPSFWAGAQDHARNVDLPALAAGAGGWEALIEAGVEGLVARGVSVSRARAWCATRPRATRGVALTLADSRYPQALRLMRTPPPVICVEGDLQALQERAIGVVGTRACTAYGRGVARHLSGVAAAAGISVVSGLARGIDGEAHRAALEVGRTVAVLGHGLGHTAPPAHVRLREAIVASGGALVSAWSDDEPPRRHTFPARNAWIAGLSRVVVVVEADEGSGALITARHALAEGRDVAAVPGPLGRSSSRGCLNLLRDGAVVVHDVEAFVAAWFDVLLPARPSWLEALFAGQSVDEIATQRGVTVGQLQGELARLEVEGAVVRQPGQRYGPGRRST